MTNHEDDGSHLGKIDSLFNGQNLRIDALAGEVSDVKNEIKDMKTTFASEVTGFRNDIKALNVSLISLLNKVTNSVIGVLLLGMILVVVMAALAMFRNSNQQLNMKSPQIGELSIKPGDSQQ